MVLHVDKPLNGSVDETKRGGGIKTTLYVFQKMAAIKRPCHR